MDVLDIVIIVVAIIAAVGGWRMGFLTRVLSWLGLAVGFLVAARFVSRAVVAVGGDSLTRFIVAAVVLVGGALVGQALGLFLGSKLTRFLPLGPLRLVDRLVGTVVGVLGVLVAVWLLVPAMADVPGVISREARNSAIAQAVEHVAPSEPDTIAALRRLVAGSSFPEVFDTFGPSPVVGPPPATTGLSRAEVDAIAQSTVEVEGIACNKLLEGTGFAVGTDLIATNAHVVAGEQHTEVLEPNGRTLPATVVLYNHDRDLALLRVPGLDERPLTLATPEVGMVGAAFGHPEGVHSLVIVPAAVREKIRAIGKGLYGHRRTVRQVLVLAAHLHPGDSGGPLVDQAGDVVGIDFAIAPDQPDTAYSLASSELSTLLDRPIGTTAVSTDACLDD